MTTGPHAGKNKRKKEKKKKRRHREKAEGPEAEAKRTRLKVKKEKKKQRAAELQGGVGTCLLLVHGALASSVSSQWGAGWPWGWW